MYLFLSGVGLTGPTPLNFQFCGTKYLIFQMGLFIMDHSVARGLAKLHVSDHTSTTLCACVIACR